jgi:hypothetical protein
MIESVTVYKRGARVRRGASIEPGATEVRLPGLPLALDDGSVRIQVEGQGVRAVDVRMAVEIAPQDPSLLPPRDEELRASEKNLALVRADVERITMTLSRLDVLEVHARPRPRRGEKPAPIPAKARMDLAKLRTAEADRLCTELAQRKAELRKAERHHADLEDRAKRASSARNTREHELRKTAIVRLEGRAEPGATLKLEYLVPGACWSPAYTVWLDEGDKARIAMRALVAQRSGEDWRGVKLVLSTADPDRWTELPELAKLRIGRAQPPKSKRGWREPPEGATALYTDFDRTFGPPDAEVLKRAASSEPPEPPSSSSGYDLSAAVMDRLEELDEEGEAPVFGAMPPPAKGAPMPSAAPMAPMMALSAPQSMRKSAGGGLLGAVGGIVMAPAALVAGAFEATRSRAPVGEDRRVADKTVRLEKETVRPDLDLDIEAMAYGRLRMFGADSWRRGELAVVAAAEVYAEGLGISVDVGVAIRVALRHAEIDPDRLPAGYVLPETPDTFDYAYAADVAADVPSDGAFHSVPVATHEAPAKMKHVAVPREASDVFRLVRIECPDAALLDGPADVYEKKGAEYTYLLTARVPPTAPQTELAIGLGVEQAIKIARNTTFTEQSTGLLGGGLALVHDVVIDVKNNLSRKAEIEVRERIPIKREDDDDIEVELGSVDPAWEEWDQDDSLSGGRMWTLKLAAGAEKTLKARYTVRISSKHQLVGGNRRES